MRIISVTTLDLVRPTFQGEPPVLLQCTWLTKHSKKTRGFEQCGRHRQIQKMHEKSLRGIDYLSFEFFISRAYEIASLSYLARMLSRIPYDRNAAWFWILRSSTPPRGRWNWTPIINFRATYSTFVSSVFCYTNTRRRSFNKLLRPIIVGSRPLRCEFGKEFN